MTKSKEDGAGKEKTPVVAGVKRGSGEAAKQTELQKRIDRLLNPQDYKDGIVPDWNTITADNSGAFTIDELVSLKPFKMEDMTAMVAFRAPEKILRSVQRIKEQSGATYDLLSDLHRDIYALGLLIMAERYGDILGGEIIIERAKNRVLQGKQIDDIVRRLAEQLMQEGDADTLGDFQAFMEHVQKMPLKVQERYITAMEMSPLLANLRRRMVEIAKREEDDA